ncbi:peptidase inhibitor family I36 protein [Spirillospora sp. CA-255316]
MRPITTGIAVLAASAALTATTSTAASAVAVARQQCPNDTVCFWQGRNYTGQRSVQQNPGPPSDCRDIPGGYAQSVVNNTAHTRTVYTGLRCDAARWDIRAGGKAGGPFAEGAFTWR